MITTIYRHELTNVLGAIINDLFCESLHREKHDFVNRRVSELDYHCMYVLGLVVQYTPKLG